MLIWEVIKGAEVLQNDDKEAFILKDHETESFSGGGREGRRSP